MIVTSPYIPRDHAIDFHARSERYSILVYHRRAGKTVACINDLIDKAVQCKLEMPEYGYIAPLYKQAKRVAWRYLKYYTRGITEKVMESELAVILTNGARIQLYGSDNPDSIRGAYFDGIVLDEYGDMNPGLYPEVVRPMLIDRKGWVVFIGTVKGPNHFYDLWKNAENNDKWMSRMLKASQSGIIPDEELEEMKNDPTMDEDSYNQEMECDWHAAIRGSYYGKLLNTIEHTNFGSYPYDPEKPVILAFDIGYSDDTAIWFAQANGNEIAIIDYFSENGLSVPELLKKLSELPYAYGTFYLPHDAKNKSFQTGKSVREQMIAAGVITRLVPSLSIQDGIQAVRKTLPQMYFNTDNPNVKFGINILRLYQREWDDKKRSFKQSPKDDWTNHGADAMRYLSLALNPASIKKASESNSIKKANVIPINRTVNLDNLWEDRKRNADQIQRI